MENNAILRKLSITMATTAMSRLLPPILLLLMIAAVVNVTYSMTYSVVTETGNSGASSIAASNDWSPPSYGYPEIVWLLSFPNSGTTYTLANTEAVTNMTIATNYVANVRGGISHINFIRPEWQNGPFLLRNPEHYEVPARFVLTRTHCYYYYLHSFTSETKKEFKTWCRAAVGPRHDDAESALSSSMSPFADESILSQYDESVQPTKAVHLIRDPVDNIVARRNFELKKLRHLMVLSEEQVHRYMDSREGFLMWCKEQRSLPPDLQEKYKEDYLTRIPCFVDLLSYIQWHNHATDMTATDLPAGAARVLYLYYEDYATDYEATVKGLYDFLEAPMVGEPVPFQTSSYREWFSVEERHDMLRAVRELSTPASLKLLKRYFDESRATTAIRRV